MMENKRKTIRRLSLIFIAVVVVSMLAFAGAGAAVNTWIVDDTAGDYHKETIADAINAATSGDTVQLGKDIIELDESIYIDKDITLDLNGHVLESTVRVFEVNVDDNPATLTVTDSRPNYGEDDPNHMGYCNSDGVWNWKYSTSEYTEPYPIKGGIITTTFDGYWSGAVVINFESSDQKFVLNGGTIAGIHAVTMGGVMSMYNYGDGGGIFEMNGGCFFGNSTTNDCGGTVLNECGATVTVNKGDFINNVFYDTDYAADECERSGGGVFRVDCLTYSCNVNINGGNFINNKCKWVDGYENTYQPGGGAIFIYGCNSDDIVGTVNISGNVLFEGNESPSGGAIGMVAANDWGGSYCGKLLLKISGTGNNVPVFKNNKAYNVNGQDKSGMGGSISMAISGNWYYTDGNPYLEISIDGAKFENNTADKNGGVIFMDLRSYARDGSNLTINNAQIMNNTATNNGGSIYLSDGLMNISGNSTISNNNATNGGGIYVGDGTMNIIGGTTGSTIDSITIDTNTATENGGGIYMGGGTMSITGRTNILTNEATNGGGFYIGDGNLTCSDTTIITTNTATENGGGVFVGAGLMALENTSIIMNNNATENGGGIYMGGGTMNVTDSVVIGSNNTAGIYGGGIYLADGTMILSDNVTVSENNAKYKGGGIYVKEGSLSMKDNVYVTKNTLTAKATDTDPNDPNDTGVHGSGFYIGTPDEVVLNDKASFGGKDELYIYSLANCGGNGITADNWKGSVSMLGLNQAQFEGGNVVVFTTTNYIVGETDAAKVMKRATLSDEEKWTLKNIYNIDKPDEEEKEDKIYAVLNHPRVASTNFMKVTPVVGTLAGTVRVSFVLSEDNSANWYRVHIYYSQNEPASESDWTEITLPSATDGGQPTGVQMRMYDPTTGKETSIQRGMYYDNEKYMTFKFDGTTHQLTDGYYGIKIEVGKDIISPTVGKETAIVNALYFEKTMPIVEKQPDYFYPFLEGEAVNAITVTATDWLGGNDITYQWEYSTDGKNWQNIDVKIPGFPGATTASIFPTKDGLEPDPEIPGQGKIMEGYYRCLMTDNTSPATNDANKKASVYSNTSQVSVEYRIFYYNGDMLLELLPDRYDRYTKVTLPTEVSIPGLIFQGWYAEPELINEVTIIPAETEGEKYFYGDFIKIPYFLILDVNGKGAWSDGSTEDRGGETTDPDLKVNVGTTKLELITDDYYVPHSVGPRANVTTFEGWSVGPERYSPVVINADGTIAPDVVVGDIRYTTENGEWLYAPNDQKSEDIKLYAHWVWPDPVVYLQSLGGQPIELNKVKVEVTNESGQKFVYKSPKNDPSVGDFLEAGEKLNLAYGVDPINGYFPEYDGWGVGHGEKVRVHVIYNNEHTIYDQEVMTI